jgi:hypothetical protein
MNLRDSVIRLITNTPKCTYCTRHGIWTVAGQHVCDDHKTDLREMGFQSEPRRC